MKELYKSPVLTVEELIKLDVLCASGDTPGTTPDTPDEQVDNIVSILGNMDLVL